VADDGGGRFINRQAQQQARKKEATITVEPGNPVADDGGARFISTQAQQQARKTEAGITVGDHNLKIRGGALKKYRDVSHRSGKWNARVCNGRNDDRTRIWIRLGTFPIAEIAAIAFDTTVFRGESHP
jgi:hypothetical protein